MPLFTAATLPFRLLLKDGSQQLRVRSFSGEEAVSKLFRFRLLVDADSHIPTARLLGQSVTFLIERPDAQMHTMQMRPGEKFLPKPKPREPRKFLALIGSVDELGVDEHNRVVYGLELFPRLWTMTQTVRSRVFEERKPLEIVDLVFASSGTGIRTRESTTSEDHSRPYCVQYFESDFDFIVRLLEEEGYVYQYDADGDKPIFSIKRFPSSFPKIGPIPFHEITGGPEQRIGSWKKTRILTATTVTGRDHLFQAPAPLLEGAASVPTSNPAIPGWEKLRASWAASIDRYPGQWAHLFEEGSTDGCTTFGGKRAWHDLQQVAGSTSASEGSSNCYNLTPGCVFELTGHPTSSGEHFVVSVQHKGSQTLDHSSGGAHGVTYENQFTSVPYAETMMYLPPRATRKPLIHGCQTATVVGSASTDEIWTDKYGRVQVQFWWDRNSTRSCWIRVATSWAGSGWGIQHIPRVGQEVVVTFLDGDPDRPLIVGSVYNPSHMPPFELATSSTQSGIRTHSTPNGKDDEVGFNEISFEDKRGSEEIYVHAQKDRTSVVENNSVDLVGNNLGVSAEKEIHLRAAKIVLEADSICIRTSEGNKEFIFLGKGEGITIESKGEKVWMNCGGKKSPEDGWLPKPE
jgi:type VI secretion system secreted protein VgrG